jgi:hypothetical protein
MRVVFVLAGVCALVAAAALGEGWGAIQEPGVVLWRLLVR